MSLLVSATPLPPTVSPGDGQVAISWAPPVFDPGTMRAVVGYILRPYIGTTPQADVNFADAPLPGQTFTLTKDGDGFDLLNGTTYTFRVAAVSSVGISGFSSPSVPVTPTPASEASLVVDPWDYTSTRIQFSLTKALRDKIDPGGIGDTRIAITRSGYGSPITPLDGTKLLDLSINEALALPFHYDLTSAPISTTWNRPYSIDGGLYDRALQAGRYYYYSLFLFIGSEWVLYSSDSAVVPIAYNHQDMLWAAIPEYYRVKDEEFLIAPNTEGDLKRFLNVIGFELDYSRTLAEGIQDIYQVERASSSLVKLLGETNLGATKEEGLGEIRYRSLVAGVAYLYNERGTRLSVQNVSLVASKYYTTTISGINDMRRADDSDFYTDTTEGGLGAGNWAPPYLNLLGSTLYKEDTLSLALHLDSPFFGGLSYRQIDNLSYFEYHSSGWPVPVKWDDSPHPNKDAAIIGDSTQPRNQATGLVICCGAGVSRAKDRHHAMMPKLTYPSEHGIRCEPDDYYTWSIYMQQIDPLGTRGTVSIGVMWFGDRQPLAGEDNPFNNSIFLPGFMKNYAEVLLPPPESLTYISKSEQVWTSDPYDSLLSMNPAYPYPVVVDADTDSSTLVPDKTTGRMAPKRYELRAKAPAAVDPKGVVYAVPYVAVQDRYATRYIACAMFSHEGNVRRNYTVAKQVDYAYTVTTDDLTTEIRASLLTEDGTNLIWEVA